MRKIKIFSDESYDHIQGQVNDWLASHKSAIIHNMLQSESYLTADDNGPGTWSLTITIFYYEGE